MLVSAVRTGRSLPSSSPTSRLRSCMTRVLSALKPAHESYCRHRSADCGSNLVHCIRMAMYFREPRFKMLLRRSFLSFFASLLLTASVAAQTAAPAKGIDDVLNYISHAWTTLSRSQDNCKTVYDERKRDTKQYVYFPADQPLPPAAADLEKRCGITAQQLPKAVTAPGQVDADHFAPHGLLYLPNAYVVPGGFFNEMYGWDSYFIIRGLIEDNKLDLARGQVENFF